MGVLQRKPISKKPVSRKPIPRKPIKVNLVRHAKTFNQVWLNSRGIKQAVQRGEGLQKNVPRKFYSSGLLKADQTAEYARDAFIGSKGKLIGGTETYFAKGRFPRILKRGSGLGADLFDGRRWREFESYIQSFPSENKAYRSWANGNIANGLIKPSALVVKDVVKTISTANYINSRRDAIQKKRPLTKEESKGIVLDYSGHSWVNDVVFERLTGKKILEKTHNVESINFTFHPKGKITLVFRKKSYDVTKRFNALLK